MTTYEHPGHLLATSSTSFLMKSKSAEFTTIVKSAESTQFTAERGGSCLSPAKNALLEVFFCDIQINFVASYLSCFAE